MNRGDYIAPPGNQGRGIRVIGAKAKPIDTSKPASEERKKRSSMEPVINLKTRIPKTAAPVQTKPAEPAAQKPDIRLTPDMIAGTKQGMKAPLERLVQQENQKNNRGPSAPPPGSGVCSQRWLKEFQGSC